MAGGGLFRRWCSTRPALVVSVLSSAMIGAVGGSVWLSHFNANPASVHATAGDVIYLAIVSLICVAVAVLVVRRERRH